jgi:hypothetical protein
VSIFDPEDQYLSNDLSCVPFNKHKKRPIVDFAADAYTRASGVRTFAEFCTISFHLKDDPKRDFKDRSTTVNYGSFYNETTGEIEAGEYLCIILSKSESSIVDDTSNTGLKYELHTLNWPQCFDYCSVKPENLRYHRRSTNPLTRTSFRVLAVRTAFVEKSVLRFSSEKSDISSLTLIKLQRRWGNVDVDKYCYSAKNSKTWKHRGMWMSKEFDYVSGNSDGMPLRWAMLNIQNLTTSDNNPTNQIDRHCYDGDVFSIRGVLEGLNDEQYGKYLHIGQVYNYDEDGFINIDTAGIHAPIREYPVRGNKNSTTKLNGDFPIGVIRWGDPVYKKGYTINYWLKFDDHVKYSTINKTSPYDLAKYIYQPDNYVTNSFADGFCSIWLYAPSQTGRTIGKKLVLDFDGNFVNDPLYKNAINYVHRWNFDTAKRQVPRLAFVTLTYDEYYQTKRYAASKLYITCGSHVEGEPELTKIPIGSRSSFAQLVEFKYHKSPSGIMTQIPSLTLHADENDEYSEIPDAILEMHILEWDYL